MSPELIAIISGAFAMGGWCAWVRLRLRETAEDHRRLERKIDILINRLGLDPLLFDQGSDARYRHSR
ncbi:MAG: hypothetical protein LAO77_23190 [Acidobacteriia bacterium]|nr:hypothetical protein [Terriglobia bacterium]